MPTLSIRVQSKRKDQHGNVVLANQSTALRVGGPRVYVTLSPFEDQIQSLAKKGEIPITPVTGMALIDTGRVRHELIELQQRKQVWQLSIAEEFPQLLTQMRSCKYLRADWKFTALGLSSVNTFRAYGVNLESQKLIALFGRDLLARCVLVYNGTDGSFSLSL